MISTLVTPSPGFVALSKQDDPQRWAQLVGANESVITQVDEGVTAVGDMGWSPSSSCSKPSIVADMLNALDVHLGHSVLEIGTGTGWNAALLCRRHGKPSLARFGMTVTADTQTVWLDEPSTVVRAFNPTG